MTDEVRLANSYLQGKKSSSALLSKIDMTAFLITFD
jgi:hypothetical protein